MGGSGLVTKTKLSKQDILDRNMGVIRSRRPDLYDLAAAEPKNLLYRITGTPSGWPNLIKLSLQRQSPVPYYDPENPQHSVQADLGSVDFRGARLVVLLGLGLGFELEHFLREIRPVSRTRHIVVIESDPDVLRLAVRTTVLEQALSDPSVHFLIGLDPARLYARLYQLFTDGAVTVLLKTMAVAHTRGALAFHRDYYLNAVKVIRQAAIEATENFGNAPHDSLVGLRHMLWNVGLILKNPGIRDLAGAFRGKPAIVASTGPSLNKHIPLLRELQDKALIIGPDASLAPLLRGGVRPHIITSLERVPKVAELFAGFDVPDTYLAGVPVLDPRAFAAYQGPIIVTYRNFDHFKWLGVDKGTLEIGPSAGNMAFKIAEFLGCDPIILVGQDLAFAEDGRSHASGAVLGDKQVESRSDNTLLVPGNHGRPVRTTRVWFRFLKYYEYDIANYRGTCINATEGGALIRGTLVMPLREVASRYLHESFDAREIIRDQLKVIEEQTVKDQAKKILGTIRRTDAAMRRVLEKCEEGENEAKALRDSLDPTTWEGRPAELEYLVSSGPLARLEQLRAEVVTMERELFQLFMAHTTQSYMIHWQMNFFAAERNTDSAPALARHFVCMYEDWFRTVGGLIRLSLETLREGENVLLREFESLRFEEPIADV